MGVRLLSRVELMPWVWGVTILIKINDCNHYLAEITEMNERRKIHGGENGLSRRSNSSCRKLFLTGLSVVCLS